MDPIVICIDDRLANPGDTWSAAGHVDERSYSLGDHDFELPGGIDYDVVLTNAGEGILATGLVRAHVVGTCDRCLERAEFDVASEVDEYYLFEEPENLGEDEDEADYELVSADRTIDLSGALVAALVMETPFVVLCREDCGHAAELEAERERERMESSPFSALAGLDLTGGGDEDDAPSGPTE